MSCPSNPLDCPGQILGGVVGNAGNAVAGSVVDQVASGISSAIGNVVSTMATLWVNVPTPGLGDGDTAHKIQASLWYYMVAIAVLSVIIAGGKMAWTGRGDSARALLQSLFTLVVVNAGCLVLIRTGLLVGDSYSNWVLNGSTGGDFDANMTKLVGALTAATGPVAPMLIIILGLLLILASFVQIVLMIARSALLVIVAGVLPLSAAATNTAWGKQWFGKVCGWGIAFLLYKPAAATIYAAAFELFGDAQGLMGSLMGVAAIMLAVLAMPALIRLIVPAAGAIGGGGGLSEALGPLAGSMPRGSSSSGDGEGPTGAYPTAGGAQSMMYAAMPSGASGGGSGGPSGSESGGGSPAPSTRATGASGGGSAGGGVAAPAGSQAMGGPAGAASSAGAGAAGGGAAAGGAAGGGAAAAGAAGPAGAAAAAAGSVASAAKSMSNGAVGNPTGTSGTDEGDGPSGIG